VLCATNAQQARFLTTVGPRRSESAFADRKKRLRFGKIDAVFANTGKIWDNVNIELQYNLGLLVTRHFSHLTPLKDSIRRWTN
jgi:hypothetical protein